MYVRVSRRFKPSPVCVRCPRSFTVRAFLFLRSVTVYGGLCVVRAGASTAVRLKRGALGIRTRASFSACVPRVRGAEAGSASWAQAAAAGIPRELRINPRLTTAGHLSFSLAPLLCC